MKLFFLAWAMLMAVIRVEACDICGCSAASAGLGILPRFQNHFIGLRYSSRGFLSKHPQSIASPASVSTGNYSTTELWGRWYPAKRIQIYAFVPFHRITDKETGSTTSITSGIGDISLLTNFIILKNGDSSCKPFKHALIAGAGVKLPTGNFSREGNPNMQTGSGSTDFLFNASYTVRYKKIGLVTEVNYRINNLNAAEYRYGNRNTVTAKLFYWKKIKKLVILPFANFTIDQSKHDVKKHLYQIHTGGNVLYTGFGAECYIRKISIGANMQIPISQNIGKGYTTTQKKFTLTFLYNF
ncbi:MAG: hypothetical protein H7321_06170 [Bacteroidia bacterium]|nr:hypothetical protein [Bacteroidia bacterium]